MNKFFCCALIALASCGDDGENAVNNTSENNSTNNSPSNSEVSCDDLATSVSVPLYGASNSVPVFQANIPNGWDVVASGMGDQRSPTTRKAGVIGAGGRYLQELNFLVSENTTSTSSVDTIVDMMVGFGREEWERFQYSGSSIRVLREVEKVTGRTYHSYQFYIPTPDGDSSYAVSVGVGVDAPTCGEEVDSLATAVIESLTPNPAYSR